MTDPDEFEDRLNKIKDCEVCDYLVIPTKNIEGFIVYGEHESPDGCHQIRIKDFEGMAFLDSELYVVNHISLKERLEGKND